MLAASVAMVSHLDRGLERGQLAMLERGERVGDLLDGEALDEVVRRQAGEQPVREQVHRLLKGLPRVHQDADERALAALEEDAVERQLRRPVPDVDDAAALAG